MKRKTTILREKNSLPSLSPIHSQKRNVPSLRSSTRSLPYRLDRGGHARFLAGWLAARLNGLTFSRAEFRSTSFHFAQSGHTRAFGQAATISSAYYAIISLTNPEGELSREIRGFGGENERKIEGRGGKRAGANIYPAIDLLERVTRTPSIRALVSCLP